MPSAQCSFLPLWSFNKLRCWGVDLCSSDANVKVKVAFWGSSISLYLHAQKLEFHPNMIYLHVGFHIDFLYNSQAHSGNTNDVPTGLHPGPWRSSLRHSDSCLVPSFAMFRVSRIGRICSKWSHENNPLLVGGFNQPIWKKYARQDGFIFPNFRGEHKKQLKPPSSLTFHYTVCWIGILVMVYYNPHPNKHSLASCKRECKLSPSKLAKWKYYFTIFHQDFPEIARGPISKKLHIWVFVVPVYFLVAIEFDHDEMLWNLWFWIPICFVLPKHPQTWQSNCLFLPWPQTWG